MLTHAAFAQVYVAVAFSDRVGDGKLGVLHEEPVAAVTLQHFADVLPRKARIPKILIDVCHTVDNELPFMAVGLAHLLDDSAVVSPFNPLLWNIGVYAKAVEGAWTLTESRA